MRENMALVHYVLRRFRNRGAEYEDLTQCGCIGLLKAIDRFDPRFDVRFSTYAVPVIMGEVRRVLRDGGPVHISRGIRDNAARVERFRAEFVRQNEREPALSEIAAGTDLTAEEIALAAGAAQRVRSLEETVGDGELTLMDVLGGEDMRGVDTRLMLSQLLRDLQPQERTIIVRRYFRAHTQSEIARDMGISQVQVSRLEKKILAQMRLRAEE